MMLCAPNECVLRLILGILVTLTFFPIADGRLPINRCLKFWESTVKHALNLSVEYSKLLGYVP